MRTSTRIWSACWKRRSWTRGQEKKLEREFARQYHLITREERLETIAEDLMRHFTGRGFLGKAMVISIDKATAVRMYDKVQAHWTAEMSRLKDEMTKAIGDEKRQVIKERLQFMESTDMAVVVSSSQNEIVRDESQGTGYCAAPANA